VNNVKDVKKRKRDRNRSGKLGNSTPIPRWDTFNFASRYERYVKTNSCYRSRGNFQTCV